MATLAVDTPRVFEVSPDDLINGLPIVAATKIYDGALVGELNDTGTYQPLNFGSTVDKFAGIADQAGVNPSLAGGGASDNSLGNAGDKNVRVRQSGRVILNVTGVTAITDIGKAVYATDDATFTLTNTSGISIGTIVRWISGTKCVVQFKAFYNRDSVIVPFVGQTTETATARTIFVATRPYYVRGITETHGVAAGGTSTLSVTKDTSTNAPGAGTDLLSADFNLNATANTPQVGAIATTAGLRKLAIGDRVAIKFANAIQSTAGLSLALELTPL